MGKTVGDTLREAAELFDERDKVHGKNYIKMGNVMSEMFPGGIFLKTPEDHTRFAMILMTVGKMGRYAECFCRGEIHLDSTKDCSVYSAMLTNFDETHGDENGNEKA